MRKHISYFILFVIIAFSFAAFNSNMEIKKSKEFNFRLSYGVTARNQIDTIKGTFTKDMVLDPPVTIKLKLTEVEMNDILNNMKQIDFFNYPDNFAPSSIGAVLYVTPHNIYKFQVYYNGKVKELVWEDENLSELKSAVKLRILIQRIQGMIEKRDEFKKLPRPNGGYE